MAEDADEVSHDSSVNEIIITRETAALRNMGDIISKLKNVDVCCMEHVLEFSSIF